MTSKSSTYSAALFVVLVGMGLSALGVVTYMRMSQEKVTTASKASQVYSLSSENVGATAQFSGGEGALMYDLYPSEPNKPLFKLPNVSRESVTAFISSQPTYVLSGETSQAQRLIPDTKSTVRLKGAYTDADIDAGLGGETFGLQNVDVGKSHYYYEQTRCDGIPVFGSYVNVHVNKDAEVYALSGALAQDDAVCTTSINDAQARALAEAEFEKSFSQKGVTKSSVEYVFNPAMLHLPGTTSHLSYFINVCNIADEGVSGYCHAYFVDRADGSIRYNMTMSPDAMNRYVTSGNTQRTEGSPATNNTYVDTAYDALGSAYEYFKSKFNRDSFDDRGARLQAQIVKSGLQANNCMFNGTGIVCGEIFTALDVIVHEFAHGVTLHTAGLIYQNESGALNEALSDIFASAVDSKDWTLGENSRKGALRSMQNPTQFGHPDSMVSSKFYCGTQDNGGVHINSGVFNKAYFLMSSGGSHNGCQTQGIGRDAAAAIIYKAITTYARGKSGGQYLDMYNAVNQACGDIHGASSATCANVKASMEATYMDKPSKCKGGSSSTKATCSGVTPGNPEPSKAPTGIQPTTTPSTTKIPTPTPTGTKPQTTPPLTIIPTLSPTSIGILKSSGVLKSTVSSSELWQGDVKITQESGKYVLRSEIYAKALDGTSFEERKNTGVQALLAINGIESDMQARLHRNDEVLELGSYKVTSDGRIVVEYTSDKDLSAFTTLEVYVQSAKQKTESPILVASLSSTQSDPASKYKVTLNMSLRFQGVERKPTSTQAQLVRIGVGGEDVDEIIYNKIVFTPAEGGVWNGQAVFEIPDGKTYKLLVKGPKHLQKKYCTLEPRETVPGGYVCEEEALELHTGINELDLSHVMQLAGDVNQDGRVNAADVRLVRARLGSKTAQDLTLADMNYDGIVNAMDDSLILYTLSNRPQQN